MRYVHIGKDFRRQQSPCPVCHHLLDGLTLATLDGRSARVEGDDYTPDSDCFSICVYCASMLRFVDDHTLRKATPDDLVELLNADPKIFDLLHKMASVADGLVRDRQRQNYGKN